ncbi:MAG: hypothetical protein PHW96_04125 [Candidatus Nanoarchaeia archaeon]|nr:hypothetical protein [Candidatus Nanoarchaeia archaeon]
MGEKYVNFRCYKLLQSDFDALKSIVENIPGMTMESLLSMDETKEYISWKNFAEKFCLHFDAGTSKKLAYNVKEGILILAKGLRELYTETYNQKLKDILNESDFESLATELSDKLDANKIKSRLIESMEIINRTTRNLDKCRNPDYMEIDKVELSEFMHRKKYGRPDKSDVDSFSHSDTYTSKACKILGDHDSFLSHLLRSTFVNCFRGEFNSASPEKHRLYFDAENGRIKTIYLKSCGLTSIPEGISSLDCLETLVLYRNHIKEVDNISGLKNLTYLNIYGNRIFVLRGLPEQLEDKLKLREMEREDFLEFDNGTIILSDDYFNLSEPQLNAFRKMLGHIRSHYMKGKKFDVKIKNSNLTELVINYPITKIPDEITEFASLEKLNLFYCRIKDISKLKELNSLNSLNLDYTLVDDVTPLCSKPLEELHLCNIISEKTFNETREKRVSQYERTIERNMDDPLFFRCSEHIPSKILSELDPRITDNPEDYAVKIKGISELSVKKLFVNDRLVEANKESIELLNKKGTEIITVKTPVHDINEISSYVIEVP